MARILRTQSRGFVRGKLGKIYLLVTFLGFGSTSWMWERANPKRSKRTSACFILASLVTGDVFNLKIFKQ